MAVIGTLVHGTIKVAGNITRRRKGSGVQQQRRTLLKLLRKAQNTSFGKTYQFQEILDAAHPETKFQENVPVFDYQSIFSKWWFRAYNGERNVSWPGKIKYFALSSGTSESASKYIPITRDIIASNRKASLQQTLVLKDFKLKDNFFEKGMLMLGGSISLNKVRDHFEGDLSGILAKRRPIWFNRYYKPGKLIAMEVDWESKLEQIAKRAKEWDIGIICGVPAWVQILIEKIISYHGVNHIHEIWPNFNFFVHGGVSIAPYEKGFSKLLGKEIYYLETYLASEGFLAYQNRKEGGSMKLILDSNIFYEFIPFTEQNFTPDGKMVEHPETLLLDDVKVGKEYAILISTNAGAWRYLIGDTIRFTDLSDHQIVITGRTKHFLSLCGEHLSVDNMNQAVRIVADELSVRVQEFAVSGVPVESLFTHRWWIGTDDQVDEEQFRTRLDEVLKVLNDDYRTERAHALKDIQLYAFPVAVFYEWMKKNGKQGGQSKFPRVLNPELRKDWESFIKQKGLS
jgi:hypothetical protein